MSELSRATNAIEFFDSQYVLTAFAILVTGLLSGAIRRIYERGSRNKFSTEASYRSLVFDNVRNPLFWIRVSQNKPTLPIKGGKKSHGGEVRNLFPSLLSMVILLLLTLIIQGASILATNQVPVPVTADEIRLSVDYRRDGDPDGAILSNQGCKWKVVKGSNFRVTSSYGICMNDESGDSKSMNLEANTGTTRFKFTMLPSGIKVDMRLDRSDVNVPTESSAELLFIAVSPDKGVLRVPVSRDIRANLLKFWRDELDGECASIIEKINADTIEFDSLNYDEEMEWTGCSSVQIDKNLATATELLRAFSKVLDFKMNEGKAPWSGPIPSEKGDTSALMGVRQASRIGIAGLLGLVGASVIIYCISLIVVAPHEREYENAIMSNQVFGTSCAVGLRDKCPADKYALKTSISATGNVAHLGVGIPQGYDESESPVSEDVQWK